MRLKPDGQDLGLDSRKRGGGAATPKNQEKPVGDVSQLILVFTIGIV